MKQGLRELDLSEDMLSVGWQRGYYRCTLAENWKEYLRGETNKAVWRDFTESDLVSYWHDRWITPRLETLKAKLAAESDLEV